MIGYLRGEVLENSEGKILVGIGAGSREQTFGMVGYLVAIPQSAEYVGFIPGKGVELFIYSHVREDALDLYGFASRMEKELFLTLLAVNGIGPKSALTILSSVQPSALIDAIINGDQRYLTQIPGIGKKTAERVVVELRDSVRKKVDSEIFSKDFMGRAQRAPLNRTVEGEGDASRHQVPSVVFQDAKSALVSLGYRENDIYTLLKRVIEESHPRALGTEDLIKTALRQLA